jgi:hypothetical protein
VRYLHDNVLYIFTNDVVRFRCSVKVIVGDEGTVDDQLMLGGEPQFCEHPGMRYTSSMLELQMLHRYAKIVHMTSSTQIPRPSQPAS